jgi:hypothetical protein
VARVRLFINASDPYLTIDAPANGSTVTQPFVLGGWAVDLGAVPPGIDGIHVYATRADGTMTFLGGVPYGGPRPDIAALHGSGYLNSGFTGSISGLSAGTYRLDVYGHSTKTGAFSIAASTTVIVNTASNPQVRIDAPASGASVTSPFTLRGSARDLGAGAGTGMDTVDVNATPDGGARTSLGRATYDTATGAFTFSVSLGRGRYQLEVAAHSLISGALTSVQVPVVVNGPSTPITAIDTPGADTTVVQPFLIGGWAIDTGAAVGPGVDGVDVYAAPNPGSGAPQVFLGNATFGGTRPDIAGAYGPQFGPSAYGLAVRGLVPGVYQLVVQAHSTVSGSFNPAIRNITVQADPRMAIDSPAAAALLNQPFSIVGWAVDLAAATGPGVTGVEAVAFPEAGGNPIPLGAATYGLARPDREAAFGAPYRNSGYTLSVSGLPTGRHRLEVRARSALGGVQAQSLTVTVNGTSNPLMVIDVPSAGGTSGSSLTVAGWAIDRGAATTTGIDRVDAYATQVPSGTVTALGTTTYGGARPDVGTAYGTQYVNSGFGLVTSALAPGAYDVTVKARSTLTGAFTTSSPVRVTVNGATQPLAVIESPASGAVLPPDFTVSGYAIDRGAGAGTGVSSVRVIAYPQPIGAPIVLGNATYGAGRTDVATQYGLRFLPCGFSMNVHLAQGRYALEVQGFSTVTGTHSVVASLSSVSVNGPTQPLMNVDAPGAGTTAIQPFMLGGWAIDRGAATGTGVDYVDIWAAPNPGSGQAAIYVGAATIGGDRPDIGTAYGDQFRYSGFGRIITGLAPGVYELRVHARSTVAGGFNNVRTVTVTVQAQPLMTLDAPVWGAIVGQPFAIGGWAIDRAASTGTGVDAIHVWAYPHVGGPAQFWGVGTFGPRPDIAALYGAQFLNAGFGLTVSGVTPGNYSVVVYSHSTVTATFSDSRMTVVTVQ